MFTNGHVRRSWVVNYRIRHSGLFPFIVIEQQQQLHSLLYITQHIPEGTLGLTRSVESHDSSCNVEIGPLEFHSSSDTRCLETEGIGEIVRKGCRTDGTEIE